MARAPAEVLPHVLLAQHRLDLAGKCDVEAALFDAVAPAVLRRVPVRDFLAELAPEQPPVAATVRDILLAGYAAADADTDNPLSLHMLLPQPPNASLSAGLAAMALHNHGSCVLQAHTEEARREALLWFVSAWLADPDEPARVQALGIVMKDTGFRDAGYLVMSDAVFRTHAALFAEATRGGGGGEALPASPTCRGTVVLYCFEYGNAWWGQWGPSNVVPGGRGLGGSEEAVVYLSAELARLGYQVEVYGDPPAADATAADVPGPCTQPGAVLWYHHARFNVSRRVDTFVSWRYAASLPLGRHAARRRLLWLHDLVPSTALPSAQTLLGEVDAVLVQSTFHQRRFLAELLRSSVAEAEELRRAWGPRVVVVPNGIASTGTPCDGANDPSVFVYGSAPNRGLDHVLRAWPRIRNATHGADDARLEVYYGFTDAVVTQLTKTMGAASFSRWHADVMRLLDDGVRHHGVTYRGSVDHAALANAFSRAGFLLYPTNFPETGCITLLKAMACGVLPVTSRFTASVLPDVTTAGGDVSDFDLGPPHALTESDAADPARYVHWLGTAWLDAVADASRRAATEPDALADLRRRMKAHVRAKYAWNTSAYIVARMME